MWVLHLCICRFCGARLLRGAQETSVVLLGIPYVSLLLCAGREVVPGSIAGEVFTMGADGQRAMVPGAHVSASAARWQREMESDAIGRYRFELVPPGRYTAEATAPGLSGDGDSGVAAGETAAAAIQLDLTAVTNSVTVTGPSRRYRRRADGIRAIHDRQTIDRGGRPEYETNEVESLLPLVPGVVRGPDGLINMKGARSTQGGWLVNSANVTDPATGAQAMNLPIDVVSSVQVISNPYDPEYGKFTGAVSSVETRTGNLEKYHLSVQNLIPRARDRDGDIIGLESVTPRSHHNRSAGEESGSDYPVVRVPLRAHACTESACPAARYEAGEPRFVYPGGRSR